MEGKDSDATPSSARDLDLPTYSRGSESRADVVEHHYQLQDSKRREWLWMTVKSRSKNPQHLPLFFDHDRIDGAIEIDFDKADGAKAISLSVSLLFLVRHSVSRIIT